MIRPFLALLCALPLFAFSQEKAAKAVRCSVYYKSEPEVIRALKGEVLSESQRGGESYYVVEGSVEGSKLNRYLVRTFACAEAGSFVRPSKEQAVVVELKSPEHERKSLQELEKKKGQTEEASKKEAQANSEPEKSLGGSLREKTENPLIKEEDKGFHERLLEMFNR